MAPSETDTKWFENGLNDKGLHEVINGLANGD